MENNETTSNQDSNVSVKNVRKLFEVPGQSKTSSSVKSKCFQRKTLFESTGGQTGKEGNFVKNIEASIDRRTKKQSQDDEKPQISFSFKIEEGNLMKNNEASADRRIKEQITDDEKPQLVSTFKVKAGHFIKNNEESIDRLRCQHDEKPQLASSFKVKDRIKHFERQSSVENISQLDDSNTLVDLHDPNVANNDKLVRRKERKKIRSFAETENAQDTATYRQSLIDYIDFELAKMKNDGFIDNDENEVLDDFHEDIYSPVEANNGIENKVQRNNLNLDEYTESLGDDIENGSYVVEAYNDDGRELIIVQLTVDKTPVYSNFLTKEIVESDFVLIQYSDNTFKDISTKLNKYLKSLSSNPPTTNSKTWQRRISTETKENKVNSYPKSHHSSHENEYIQTEESDIISPKEIPSNRSTMYSSTSRESDDEDDEGISLAVELRKPTYNSARRETYCDDKGIVRIERVEPMKGIVEAEKERVPMSPSSSSMTPLTKLNYIMNEIKTTERKYIEDLAKIVKTYRPHIRNNTPASLREELKYLYGNIVDIYRHQKEFLEDLEDTDDVNGIVRKFVMHEPLFKKYPTYFRNKPRSDRLLREFSPIIKKVQEIIDDRLDFSAYLLTPVQRLGKYKLFLENILSTLTKLELPIGTTQMALDIIKKEMSKGNDYVAIESIQNSPISRLDYGSFKMREKFTILKPKRVEAMVFLFTNVIVIATSDPKELEVFNYFDCIKMIDLRIATFDDLTIHLTNFTKSKKKNNSSRYTYVLESRTDKIKNVWKEAIEGLLWEQLLIVKEKTMKRSKQKGIENKTAATTSRNRIKSTGSSIFYVD